MTESGTGADGVTPDRPRDGVQNAVVARWNSTVARWNSTLVRQANPGIRRASTVVHRGGSRLGLTLLVAGAAILLLTAGVFIGRLTQPSAANPTAASAPADLQAGNLIGGILQAAGTGGGLPRVQAPPLAASDDRAAAAVAIHIPRLKIDQRIIGLHTLRDRTISVPQDFSDIGWWTEGPHPGGPGASLFAGHISSRSGPAVFFTLSELQVGDKVTVDRADRTSAVFKVVGKASYPRSNFPDEVVYRSQGKPSIHLVTCDGAFNASIGHHEDNLVVFADLVSTGPTRKGKP